MVRARPAVGLPGRELLHSADSWARGCALQLSGRGRRAGYASRRAAGALGQGGGSDRSLSRRHRPNRQRRCAGVVRTSFDLDSRPGGACRPGRARRSHQAAPLGRVRAVCGQRLRSRRSHDPRVGGGQSAGTVGPSLEAGSRADCGEASLRRDGRAAHLRPYPAARGGVRGRSEALGSPYGGEDRQDQAAGGRCPRPAHPRRPLLRSGAGRRLQSALRRFGGHKHRRFRRRRPKCAPAARARGGPLRLGSGRKPSPPARG